MPTMREFTVRLSPAQCRMLDRLVGKLHIDKTSIIRLALTRLAEAEGLVRVSDDAQK